MNSTLGKEPIEIIDVIRGIALLGVLIVNMRFFNTSSLAISLHVDHWTGFWDRLVNIFEDTFIVGKFISIFSFLFGFGMIMIRDNALANGRNFVPQFTRRLLTLMVFGLIHGLLIWFGDILFHYALLGLLLMLFARCKSKTLLTWSVILLSLLPVFILLTNSQGSFPVSAELEQIIAIHNSTYGEGPFSLLAVQRINDWIGGVLNQIVFYPQLLGMFLLGGYFAKRKLFHNIPGNKPLILKLCGWTFILFAGLTALNFLPHKKWADLAMITSWPIGAVFYMTLIALLFELKRCKSWLRPFAYIGKMAFTNYIMQSVIGTIIFYSYGLGLFGKVGHAAGLLISLVIFATQIVCSQLWLKKFRMGPLEWIWRALTYLKFHPFKKQETKTLRE